VYIPLKQFNDADVSSFENAFLTRAGQSGLLASDSNSADLECERVRVYLDGLDELSSAERQKRVGELAHAATRNNPKLEVIITARDYDYGPDLQWIPKLHLADFSEDQSRELITKWLDDNQEDVELFCSQLSETSALKILLRIPLLATLIVLVFKQTHSLPENKARLYDIFVSLLSSGWDLAKGVHRQTNFALGEKLLILTRLAVRVHNSGQRRFSNGEFQATVERTLANARSNDWLRFRDEVLRDGLVRYTKADENFVLVLRG
jgi:hypothetical protein